VGKRKNAQRGASSAIKLLSYLITALIIFVFVYSSLLYSKGALGYSDYIAYSSISISLFFSSVVFSYLLFIGKDLNAIIGELGLSRDRLTWRALGYGIILLFLVFMLEISITLFSYLTKIPLPTNVDKVLQGAPMYFLVFSVFAAPVNEEIFFRGFLVPRAAFLFRKMLSPVHFAWVSITISALIFAVLHLTYISASEFFAAFAFGMLAGYVFYKTNSLYPSIFAHFAVNGLAVLALLYGAMLLHA